MAENYFLLLPWSPTVGGSRRLGGELPERIGHDVLSADQLATAQELGLLVDRDPEGVLIQVVTSPPNPAAPSAQAFHPDTLTLTIPHTVPITIPVTIPITIPITTPIMTIPTAV